MESTTRPQLFRSFWHGGDLTPLEQLSITSFLEHGHTFALFVYEEVSAPPGCLLEDAAVILPLDQAFEHDDGVHAGSLGAFSDRFRYELLKARGGWWVDTDVLCLSAEIPGGAYAFAEQESGIYNGAVLRAPAESALVAVACERARRAGNTAGYASIGPRLLTDLVAELGLEEHAWPTREVYPLGWREALDVLDPRAREAVGARTHGSRFLHLWGEILRLYNVLKTVRPPNGSFLADMYDRYGISFPAAPRYEFSQLRPQLALQRKYWALREEVTRLQSELREFDSSRGDSDGYP